MSNANEIEKDNRRLYDDYYKDINTRILSNIENHDKAILSLSTAIFIMPLKSKTVIQ